MFRTTIVVAALFAVAAAVPIVDRDLMPVVDRSKIEEINSMQSSWTAGVNENFVGMTLLEAKRLLGVKPFGEGNVSCTHNVSAHVDVSALPTDFDARTTWPTFVHPVRDQGQCGSCWAHAASETFSDKLAIATKGSVNEIFSVQELVSCDTAKDMGCGGGWPEYAFNYMMTKGLPSDTCYPYTSGQGDSGTCLSACKDGSAKMLTTHKIKSWDYVNGEAAMMAALVNGPIAVAFAVYEDFFSYKTGVYVPNKASGLAGYHAVKMVGYGVTTGPKPQKYWIVANSWGLSWGNQGYFQIQRGVDACGIEYGPLDRGCPIAAVAM